jgi:hypothetical protein
VANLLRPIFDTRWPPPYFGVGAPLHQAGVPSIGYLTGPNYLITISEDGEMSKLDPERMRLETEWVINTLHRLPAWKLRLTSSFRHRLGVLLAAISLFVGTYWTIHYDRASRRGHRLQAAFPLLGTRHHPREQPARLWRGSCDRMGGGRLRDQLFMAQKD